MTLLDRITVNPEICHGSPTIGGLRYPVSMIMGLLADHQQSTTTTLNMSTGQLGTARYTPYGNLRTSSATTDQLQLGQTHDYSTNLNYLNNRYHDPTVGVFVSVDPLVTMTGQPYVYGAANPVTYSDPSGLCIEPGTLSFNDDGSYSYIPVGGPECSDWDDVDDTDSPELPATSDSYGIKSDVKRVEHGIGGGFTGLDPTLANVALVGGALFGGAFLASNATWRTGVSLAGDKARDWWRGRNGGPEQAQYRDPREILSELKDGRSLPHKEVETVDDLIRVFNELKQGGTQVVGGAGRTRYQLPDGSFVQLREFSGSKGWTIDYFPPGGGQIKVHLP